MFFTWVACSRNQRPSASFGLNQSIARPSFVQTCFRLPTDIALAAAALASSPKHQMASTSSCSASVFRSCDVYPVTIFERATGQIAGVENLVEIAGDKRVGFGRNGDHRVSNRERGITSERKPSRGASAGTEDANRSNGLIYGDCDIPERRIVHRAIKLVGPRRVRENALDAKSDFCGSLLFANHCGETLRNFIAPLGKILRAVVKNLGTIVRGSLGPRRGLARRSTALRMSLRLPSGASPSNCPSAARTSCCSRSPAAPAYRLCRA